MICDEATNLERSTEAGTLARTRASKVHIAPTTCMFGHLFCNCVCCAGQACAEPVVGISTHGALNGINACAQQESSALDLQQNRANRQQQGG